MVMMTLHIYMGSPDPRLVGVTAARQLIHSSVAHMMSPGGPTTQVIIST